MSEKCQHEHYIPNTIEGDKTCIQCTATRLRAELDTLQKSRNRLIDSYKKLEAELAAAQEDIKLLCSQEPCPKCGYGVTGACYGCEIKRLKADLATTEGALKDRTKDEIHALIEKYGDPQYKTSEFALYDFSSPTPA